MDIAARQHALRRILEGRGIQDARVLDAIEHTRRDLFIPGADLYSAYSDTALSIDRGQTISQPYIVALMTEALRLTGTERVLEVGTGSGYQAAVVSKLCRELVTIERLPSLADDARTLLESLGITNIAYRIGDGTLGCAELAPYDGILVTAAAPRIPEPLYEQLAPFGRLIVPVGSDEHQELLRVVRGEGGPVLDELCGCRFVKLIGAAGWPESPPSSECRPS